MDRKKLIVSAWCLALVFRLWRRRPWRRNRSLRWVESVGNSHLSQDLCPTRTPNIWAWRRRANRVCFAGWIKSPYVLVEQFKTSCPHCMAQAPVLNNLYNLVQQDRRAEKQAEIPGDGPE